MMNKLRVIGVIVSLLYLPWSLYLTYLVLTHIGATELMWFLFWLMIPMAIFVGLLGKIISDE